MQDPRMHRVHVRRLQPKTPQTAQTVSSRQQPPHKSGVLRWGNNQQHEDTEEEGEEGDADADADAEPEPEPEP